MRFSPSNLVLHRGNHAIEPGNTIEGITEAYRGGIRSFEIDVRQTIDGSFFLFHDRNFHENNSKVSRALYGTPVERLSKKNLNLLCPEHVGVKCPVLLEELLKEFKGTSISFFLDVKNISPQRVAALIERIQKERSQNEVVMQCPTKGCVYLVKALDPQIRILLRIRTSHGISEAIDLKPFAVQVDSELLKREYIEAIHKAGIRVLTKAVDTEYESEVGIAMLVESGADYVLTDLVVKR